MKSIRSLFIVLVGMAFTTVQGTTTSLEQKPNSTIEIVANVDYQDNTTLFVLQDYPEFAFEKAVQFVKYEPIFKSLNILPIDVGWSFKESFKKSNQLNIISCQKLEQNSFVNQSKISKKPRWQILEPYMERMEKTKILPNLLQVEQLKSVFLMTHLHQMCLYQEKTIT